MKIFIFIILILILVLCNCNFKKFNGGSGFYRLLEEVCDDLNLKYNIKDGYCYIKHKNKEVIFNKGQRNNLDNTKEGNIIDDKITTANILCKNKKICPKKIIIIKPNNNQDIRNIIKKINNNIEFPLVVKPNNSCCGRLVSINIENNKELKNILENKVLKQGKDNEKFIVEKYIEGISYRVLCYKDKILDIYYRDIPKIKGDGKHTILELVNIYEEFMKILEKSILKEVF